MVGKLWLIHVQPPTSFLHGLDNIPLVRSDAAACRTEQHALEKVLQGRVPPDQRGGTLVRIGAPDHEIVQAAREIGADLILMTTHGHQGIQRVLNPSISERVVRHAPCPVLTVNRAR